MEGITILSGLDLLFETCLMATWFIGHQNSTRAHQDHKNVRQVS